MTEQNAPDITTGFIQMVEAFKAKPELEAQIRNMSYELDVKAIEAEANQRRIAELESSLAASSEDKARLTRERDEAMFRTLELEEKTSAVADLLAKLDGVVRPEPVAKVEAPAPVSDGTQVGQEAKPTYSDDYRDGRYSMPEGSHSAFTDRYAESATSESKGEQHPFGGYEHSTMEGEAKGTSYGYGEAQHEPNAEQRSSVESQYYKPVEDQYHNIDGSFPEHKGHENLDSPIKSEQNSSEQSMGHTDVSKPRINEGKPYSDKPYWVSDSNWRAEGGQGPYEGGSWTTPWSDRAFGS